jgi:hypothetical protein
MALWPYLNINSEDDLNSELSWYKIDLKTKELFNIDTLPLTIKYKEFKEFKNFVENN